MTSTQHARFSLGDVVVHRQAAFQGVVIDVDPAYDGHPAETGGISSQQPFYRVLVLDEEDGLILYAAESALERDAGIIGLTPQDQRRLFTVDAKGRHAPLDHALH